MLHDLAQRGEGRRESGAFLLGTIEGDHRFVRGYLLYDDIDPDALQGIILFDGGQMDKVWDVCARHGWRVVADVHTHPGGYGQSSTDRAHPMMPRRGHLALIVPDFASRRTGPGEIGIYEYLGGADWADHSARGPGFFRLRRFA
ncbi:hypothetical protein CDQ92_02125 [Sphingopyxis bauzanensis]|uniref:JAB domain-containing protein n=1 Tax=Sphingopyxis bauzanensis TaxID=651663 RepID=A0A246K0H4_9SPHN|nr:Mov34/MPN/PAD-1 family protein [Sphingopyxis bauzanensis]OWQ98996.1 hypothetical protein CDQ92_02125 [Sphingopyxis bauzanensis]